MTDDAVNHQPKASMAATGKLPAASVELEGGRIVHQCSISAGDSGLRTTSTPQHYRAALLSTASYLRTHLGVGGGGENANCCPGLLNLKGPPEVEGSGTPGAERKV